MQEGEKRRLISPETTRIIEMGGLIAGLIGWVTEIGGLKWGGFGITAAVVVYDFFASRTKRTH
jgi:hypothetical protein